MNRADRQTLARISRFNAEFGADALNAMERNGGELRPSDLRTLGQSALSFGLSLLASADERDAVSGELYGSVRRMPSDDDGGAS